MLLILVEVSVKVEVQTAGTELSPWKYLVACQSMTPQSYLHATYSDGSICESGRISSIVIALCLQSVAVVD